MNADPNHVFDKANDFVKQNLAHLATEVLAAHNGAEAGPFLCELKELTSKLTHNNGLSLAEHLVCHHALELVAKKS